MKIQYTAGREFKSESLSVIATADDILNEYTRQGFVLTLRQLYYQFVARGLLNNTDKSYHRLGRIINDARLAGLIDWDHLIDRTRSLKELQHFDGATDALTKLAGWYHVDMWKNQPVRPEVWIEKDALVGVIEGVCQEFDVPFFSCRGYTSQSEMWAASQRLLRWDDAGQTPFIIHLGDHDPSGIDMSRDIQDRLEIFMGVPIEFKRIALNMDQIEEYGPPPNPAKVTDSRAASYISRYGDKSWELDAMEPLIMVDMIGNAIASRRNEQAYNHDVEEREVVRGRLHELAEDYTV